MQQDCQGPKHALTFACSTVRETLLFAEAILCTGLLGTECEVGNLVLVLVLLFDFFVVIVCVFVWVFFFCFNLFWFVFKKQQLWYLFPLWLICQNLKAKILGFFILNIHNSRMLLCLNVVSLVFPNSECLWGTSGFYGFKELLLYS